MEKEYKVGENNMAALILRRKKVFWLEDRQVVLYK